jgi:hypothetical protein
MPLLTVIEVFLMHTALKMFLAAVFCSACAGSSGSLRPLNDVLAEVAKDNDFRYVRPPVAGLRPGWIIDDAGVRSTPCWSTSSQRLRSLTNVTASGTDSSEVALNFGVRLLSLFGVDFELTNSRAKSVDLSLTGWSTAEGADLTFQWNNLQCIADLERGPTQVIRRLLTFASIDAAITTASGTRISLDSGSIRKGSVTVNVDAAKADFTSNGTIVAKAESVSVGARYAEWKLQRFLCPESAVFRLPTLQQFFAPGPCPGNRKTWYRIGVFGTSSDGVQVRYQNLTSPTNSPQDTVVTLGSAFLLSALPRRADVATIVQNDSGEYSVRLERFELIQSDLLGNASMLSEEQAGANLIVNERLNEE